MTIIGSINQPKTRDLYFDNLKSVLIFLVVLGHFTDLNRSIPLMGAVNNVIYAFHMPLFIFVSGYFSRSIIAHRASEIENILYSYFVFQVLHLVFTLLTGLGYGTINLFKPVAQNWYLLGLFFWRLLAPYFNMFNKKYALLFTVILTFSIGFFKDFSTFLGLYRIIYFFPMFIIGYYCSDLKSILNRYSNYKYFFISFSFFILLLIFGVSFYSDKINDIISLAYTPYSNYAKSTVLFISRFIGFFSSIFISFGLLFLVPVNKSRITYIGENTLNIFLLHMFIVIPVNYYMTNISGYLVLIISLVSSVLICLALSTKVIREILVPITSFSQLRSLIKKLS